MHQSTSQPQKQRPSKQHRCTYSCKFVTQPSNSTEKEPNNPTSNDIAFNDFNSMYDSGKCVMFLLLAKCNWDNLEHRPIESGNAVKRLYRIDNIFKEHKLPMDSGKSVMMFSSMYNAVKFVKHVNASGNVTNRFFVNHNVRNVRMLPKHGCKRANWLYDKSKARRSVV